MTWSEQFPPTFDVGTPNAGHMHFGQDGSQTLFGPDGATVLFKLDPTNGMQVFKGSLTLLTAGVITFEVTSTHAKAVETATGKSVSLDTSIAGAPGIRFSQDPNNPNSDGFLISSGTILQAGPYSPSGTAPSFQLFSKGGAVTNHGFDLSSPGGWEIHTQDDGSGNPGTGHLDLIGPLSAAGSGSLLRLDYDFANAKPRVTIGQGGTTRFVVNGDQIINGTYLFGPDTTGPQTGVLKYGTTNDTVVIDTWANAKPIRIGGSEVDLGLTEAGGTVPVKSWGNLTMVNAIFGSGVLANDGGGNLFFDIPGGSLTASLGDRSMVMVAVHDGFGNSLRITPVKWSPGVRVYCGTVGAPAKTEDGSITVGVGTTVFYKVFNIF